MLLDDPAIQYHYTVAMGHVDNTKTIQNIYLGGGFKYCLFSPLLREMIQFD